MTPERAKPPTSKDKPALPLLNLDGPPPAVETTPTKKKRRRRKKKKSDRMGAGDADTMDIDEPEVGPIPSGAGDPTEPRNAESCETRGGRGGR